jgi:hypothetical protein
MTTFGHKLWRRASGVIYASVLPLSRHHDYKVMSDASRPSLNDDSLPIGTAREWGNAKSGNRGTVQLLKRFEYEYQGSKFALP